MKKEMSERLQKEGISADKISSCLDLVCKKYVWWDPSFTRENSLYAQDKPHRKVFIIEGEFKALAAGQSNLESIMGLTRQLAASNKPAETAILDFPQPTLFEVGGTSGVNGSYLALDTDKCHYATLRTYRDAFHFESVGELFLSPDGDGGRWDTYCVVGGGKTVHGTKKDQPGNIGVLHGTVATARAYGTEFPHLQCYCVDLAALELKHDVKGLDEVYRAAGAAALLQTIATAKVMHPAVPLTWGQMQEKLLRASEANDRTQNGFDLITYGQRIPPAPMAHVEQTRVEPKELPGRSQATLDM